MDRRDKPGAPPAWKPSSAERPQPGLPTHNYAHVVDGAPRAACVASAADRRPAGTDFAAFDEGSTTENPDCAGVSLHGPDQDPDQRGLSRSVGADQADDLALATFRSTARRATTFPNRFETSLAEMAVSMPAHEEPPAPLPIAGVVARRAAARSLRSRGRAVLNAAPPPAARRHLNGCVPPE